MSGLGAASSQLSGLFHITQLKINIESVIKTYSILNFWVIIKKTSQICKVEHSNKTKGKIRAYHPEIILEY